jgi:hypothetical protein
MGWYADPDDAVCVVLQAAGDAAQQREQLSSAAGGNALPTVADASCMAKNICGVGYSRLQRGDSLEHQEQLQQGAAAADAAAAAIAVATAQLQAQEEEECYNVLHVEPRAAAGAVLEAPAHAHVNSALLLGDGSLLSPYWMASSLADDVSADAEEEPLAASDSSNAAAKAAGAAANRTATLAAATLGSRTTAAAAAPVTVEELLAASEAVIVKLKAAFAGVRYTAGLLAEARVPLRERYGS